MKNVYTNDALQLVSWLVGTYWRFKPAVGNPHSASSFPSVTKETPVISLCHSPQKYSHASVFLLKLPFGHFLQFHHPNPVC